ncbi:hypothetical protein KTR10_01330 [Candidatus Kaiserbacteria bacterium]|nr:hypothetical protein [Candidatus Kaiserbacteria bacterium]
MKETDPFVECKTKTNYPVIVPIGTDCLCKRGKGHIGRHIGIGYDGKYFSWRYDGAYGCVLSDEISKEEADRIIEADKEEANQEFVQVAE